MKQFFTTLFFVGAFITITTAQNKIPLVRQAFHDRVDRSQLALEAADRTADGHFTPYYDNDALNKAADNAATNEVDALQQFIEDKNWDNNTKLKYLRGLQELLEAYRSSFIVKGITGAQLVNVLKAYKAAVKLDKKGDDITPIVEKYKYQVSVLIAKNYSFQNNSGMSGFNNILVRKNLLENPAQSLRILNDVLKTNPNFPGVDSIVHITARDSSDAVYTWSQSYGSNYPLGEYIRKSDDPLVRTISQIANSQRSDGSKSGRQFMPFLDALYKGDITMDKIENAMNDDVAYFKLLVKTEIQYATNESKGDTAMALQIMRDKIGDWGIDKFINIVNGLHEKSNEVRYACLKGLSPIDLYYLVVTSEDVIYTSTYVNGKDYGIYNIIWQKGGKELSGDKLLMDVHFDYFKKWIKMAANYNTLDNFLARMEPANARILMKAFVRGLDKSSGKDDLEDAVDVAGSFSSIDNPDIKQLVLNEVQSNLDAAKKQHNEKAYNIYYILNTLFLSMDQSNNIDLSEKLGIEPVYFLPIDKLKDSSGRIVIQQFTYGDQDGAANYGNFMDMFSRLGWKISVNKYWSTVSSTKGTRITIYTNRPLDEKQHLDDDAQEALNNYLDENDIHPTLAFHRGHSYYLKSSIKQLQPSEKLVFLGSCGGFQSLNDVLKASPGTQIISTKQTGAGDLNLPMIRDIIISLQKGQDLNWVKMWKGFTKQLSKDNRFADYVPPYENLGAVFLVAYQKLQEKEKENADSKDISITKMHE